MGNSLCFVFLYSISLEKGVNVTSIFITIINLKIYKRNNSCCLGR